MSSWLLPDYIFATYREVTPEFLRSIGIKALLIDIDNTLAPYEQPLPDEHIKAWFSSLKQNGISATLVSNNDRERAQSEARRAAASESAARSIADMSYRYYY